MPTWNQLSLPIQGGILAISWQDFMSEPVFLNVYGAPELIPRNEFRQPM